MRIVASLLALLLSLGSLAMLSLLAVGMISSLWR
jgi:hypothetical protein